MKAPSLILIIFLLAMIVVFVVLEAPIAHNQRNNNQRLEKDISELTQRSGELEAEVKELRQQLAAQPPTNPVTAAEVAPPHLVAANDTHSSTNDDAAKPPPPQPFQARAYVGKDFVGMAWVIPTNIRETTNGGEYRFEPVIWIEEKARKTFTQTNVVEREVVRNNSYTQVYEQPYWYAYPVWVRPKTDRPGTPGGGRPPVTLPSPGRPGGAFSPPIIGNDRSAPISP